MRRIAVFVGAAVLATAAGASSHARAAGSTVDYWVDTVEEEQLLRQFEANAEAAGALGFYLNDETSSLAVLVPYTNKAAFDLRDLGPSPVPVELKFTDIDLAALELANQRLSAVALGRQRGETIAFFFNPRSEQFEVTGSVPEARLLAEIGDSNDLVTYRTGSAITQSRFNDFAPFWGGSALDWQGYYDPVWDCSSGFAMTNGTTRALLTVAHCGPTDARVVSPDADREIGIAAGSGRYCPTSPSGPPSNNADVQLITGKTYDNTIYIGDRTGGAGIVNHAARDPSVGAHYAVSGARTYEHTNLEVTSLSGTLGDDACGVPGFLSSMIVYTLRQGPVTTCPEDLGDSGAPLYLRYSGTPTEVGIRGMHIGEVAGDYCYAMRYSIIASVTGFTAITN